MKSTEPKYKPHLVYSSTVKAIAEVRAYGIEKHRAPDVLDEETWKNETTMDILDAARRHLDETIEAVRTGDMNRLFDNGENGSGKLHLAHMMANGMFLIERFSEKGEL